MPRHQRPQSQSVALRTYRTCHDPVCLDDLDRDLRMALFAHIDRLRRGAGGVITAAQLNEGITFRGERVPLWNQRKGIFKPRILGSDGAALTIQTSLGPRLPNPPAARHPR